MSQSRLTFFWGGAYLVSNLVECTWTLVKVVVRNAASKDQFKLAFSAFEKTTYVTCFYVPCDIFQNNNMIMFWKPTRLKTKNILGYDNDVLNVWPHVMENNQAGTIVLEESPATNFGNTPWHFRFSQSQPKANTVLGDDDVSEVQPIWLKMSREQCVWRTANCVNFRNAPWSFKISNIWGQPITCLEMITLRKFSQFDWWPSNAKNLATTGWLDHK